MLALVAILCGGLVSVVVSSRSVSGPTNVADGETHKVGDGDLPTSRPALRASRAPLSPAESGYAAHLATSSLGGPQPTDVRGDKQAQVLFVDLPRLSEASSDRVAVVMLYDYATDLASQVTVNLSTGRVLGSDSDAELQPPPAPDEADAAMRLAIESDIKLAFTREFEESNGVPLLSLDQVGYRAGAWKYVEGSRDGKQCGKHRCVQLLVQEPSGSYLDTGDFVVDLTQRSIVTLETGGSR